VLGFLGAGGYAAASSAAWSVSPPPKASAIASDEAYWARVAADFDLTPDLVNLENGYWGIMSRPVMAKYIDQTRAVNRNNSYFARRAYNEQYLGVIRRVAAELGAQPDEIALTRGATEALQSLINGYRNLAPGDAVMVADLDYYSMVAAMETLAHNNQCSVVRLDIPEPTDHASLIQFYTDALARNPKVKLLLLTHIGHRTGLMIPVGEITAMAKARGVDVIVDAAHSFGQMITNVDEIGADFIGFNLHKWVGAPLGAGVMYIRKNRLDTIAPNPSSQGDELNHTYGRVHTGTVNFAAMLSIPTAFEYRNQIGGANIAARLRYLRNLWVGEVLDLKGLQILTPQDDRLHAGITSFRLVGKTSTAENKAIVEHLLHEYGIFTVHRDGVAKGACVRVTPAIFTSAQDVLRLASALQDMVKAP